VSELKSILKRFHSLYSSTYRDLLLCNKDPDFETTFFEGGLGSQILAYIEYSNKSRAYFEPNFVDVSYFTPVKNLNSSSKVITRNWRLDHFGIELAKLREFSRKVEKKNKRRPNDRERTNFGLANGLFEINSEILMQFPIKSEQSYRNKLFFSGRKTPKYGVVHIRKGDYLSVASKIVTVGDITKTLGRIKDTLPTAVVFVTDGIFSEKEKLQIRDSVGEAKYRGFRFFDESSTSFDEIVIHDLMRCAEFLLTSNSTFSYTAGLLNDVENSKVLFPINFYSGYSADLNPIFQSNGTFALLDKGAERFS